MQSFVLFCFVTCLLATFCSALLVTRTSGNVRLGRTMLSPCRASHLYMSTRGSGGGGATKLDTRTSQKTATKPTYKEEIEKDWRLVLHDDTVHTIQQVCDILSKNCPLCSGPRAYEVTLEVHMSGAGTVCVANKKIVEEYTKKLQAAGLTVSMSPDEAFEGGGEDEGEEAEE
eukprot:gene11648-13063_t